MRNGTFSHGDGGARDDADVFAPRRVDEAIATLAQTSAPDARDTATGAEARVVRGLVSLYRQPDGSQVLLSRVRTRVLATPLDEVARMDHQVSAVGDVDDETLGPAGPVHGHGSGQRQLASRYGAGLRALATVLVMGILVGGFLAVLRARNGQPAAATAAWEDVRPCTSAPADPSAIQPGGMGASGSTLAAHWGPADGVAAGTTYFGKYTDSGKLVASVPSIDATGRVSSLTYQVDPTQRMSLAQAQALAATILPQDAAPQSGLQTVTDNGVVYDAVTYCSGAFAAVFPAGSSDFFVRQSTPGSGINASGQASNGLIRVAYQLSGGDVVAIWFYALG